MNINISTIKDEITTILENKIREIIKADLTIGRTDNYLPPLIDEKIYNICEKSKIILLMIDESSSELLSLKKKLNLTGYENIHIFIIYLF